MVADRSGGATATSAERRNSRRRRGVVCFFGLETLGFDGPATIVSEAGACPGCLEAGRSAHEGCLVSAAAAAAAAKGLVAARRQDGEWVLELTPEGLARAEEIDRARRARRGGRQ